MHDHKAELFLITCHISYVFIAAVKNERNNYADRDGASLRSTRKSAKMFYGSLNECLRLMAYHTEEVNTRTPFFGNDLP